MNATSSVSFFERLYLPASNPLTLEEIIILIRTRRWEHEITAYRAAHPALEGNRNHTVYRLGCEANRRGFNAEETARFCVPLLQAPDFSEEEIVQALSSAYQGNTCEYDTRRNTGRTQKDKKDTATISGEELRERTPFLPPTITDGLPPLLADALRFYADRRERDMAFRAALAIVDVCLEHSRLLMTQLKASDETPELTCPDYFRQLFDRLPAEFNLSDLYALTQAVGISDRTVRRHLSRLEPQYITRLSPGLYRKTTIPAA